MDNTKLKIFTIHYVNEHDLVKEDKLGLMEWVKDADMDQVKHLLLTGEVKDKLVQEDLDFIQENEKDLEEKVEKEASRLGVK